MIFSYKVSQEKMEYLSQSAMRAIRYDLNEGLAMAQLTIPRSQSAMRAIRYDLA